MCSQRFRRRECDSTVYHSRCSVLEAASDAGLVLTDERDLWIDRETAVQMFGICSIGCMPTRPTYWMLTMAKSGAVTNGHANAALLNGFISKHQAAVASAKQCGLCGVIPMQMRTADTPAG